MQVNPAARIAATTSSSPALPHIPKSLLRLQQGYHGIEACHWTRCRQQLDQGDGICRLQCVSSRPEPPSDAIWKVPAPRVEFWKPSVVAWPVLLVICSNPVDESYA